jgi:hypothetical protein
MWIHSLYFSARCPNVTGWDESFCNYVCACVCLCLEMSQTANFTNGFDLDTR